MKIAGLWNNHDCSFCILDDGKPTIHAELERYIREKEPKGDSYKFLKDIYTDEKIDEWITAEGCFEQEHSFKSDCYEIGHHQAHAANTFFSSFVVSLLRSTRVIFKVSWLVVDLDISLYVCSSDSDSPPQTRIRAKETNTQQ